MSAAVDWVYVVDDDEAVRDALRMLFDAAGLRARAFASAREFIDGGRPAAGSCLVLDIRMPGMSGLELQETLLERDIDVPIVFITGNGDVPMAVEAMKRGAFDFIEKPFDGERLVAQVRRALESANAHGMATLSEREREVLDLVLEGKPSREVATLLSISAKTVEFHRARIMRKLGVRSAAELFRLCLSR